MSQDNPRPRVLLLTSNPPADEMGGSMLLFRQFVQRCDYELFVITDQKGFHSDDFPYLIVEHSQLIQRIQKTRFSLLAHDYVNVLGGLRIPDEILDVSRRFRPDLIMTGAETWIADLAIRLARRINRPVAGYFMDWPTHAMLGHDIVKRWCSRQFPRRYLACDLAFGICPEMLEALGPHPNNHVFYPPGNRSSMPVRSLGSPTDGQRFQCLFAGNLGQWYGQMLLGLADAIREETFVHLRIAGKNAEWSPQENQQLATRNIFCGFLKGEQYEAELCRADVLLVLMGFGEDCRQIESTSFKSKLADYLLTGKPILVWGPDYSTAVRSARQFGYAEVVDSPDPHAVIEQLKCMAADRERCAQIVTQGRMFFEDNLEADKVFDRAFEAVKSLIASRAGGTRCISRVDKLVPGQPNKDDS